MKNIKSFRRKYQKIVYAHWRSRDFLKNKIPQILKEKIDILDYIKMYNIYIKYIPNGRTIQKNIFVMYITNRISILSIQITSMYYQEKKNRIEMGKEQKQHNHKRGNSNDLQTYEKMLSLLTKKKQNNASSTILCHQVCRVKMFENAKSQKDREATATLMCH